MANDLNDSNEVNGFNGLKVLNDLNAKLHLHQRPVRYWTDLMRCGTLAQNGEVSNGRDHKERYV